MQRFSGLRVAVKDFLADKRLAGLSPRSLEFYQLHLGTLVEFLEGVGLTRLEDVTVHQLRQYLAHWQPRLKPMSLDAKWRAASIHDLRSIWIDPPRRAAFLDELREQSVRPEVLAKLIERPDADTFDVLASVAFAAPVLSRDERAKAVENLGQRFLNAFGPDAREVLLALLEKYSLAGIEELRPEVFHIPPFDRMGYAAGVTARFGGPERLRTAMDRLQKEIYLAEVVA
ncbi:MAG: type I restriction-modification enzyme R subunit C-terminal domain-containing protein [Chloroflexota bacterium]|nr:type I restriction-modification enzyme R subunit C-terminal domain-containing protein [Chloroflexota bacterium]